MRPTVVMSVIDDYAYIPTTWRTKAADRTRTGCQPATTPPSS